MRRVTGLDWPLLALGGCLLVLSAAGAIAVTHFDDPNVGVVLVLQCVPYAIAAWLVLRGGPHGADSGRALATILIVGVAMRCLLLPGTPVSTDLFRYVWDGRVQAAGINPYLYIPSDAALSSLRDDAIYPFMNRADYAPTMYPPQGPAAWPRYIKDWEEGQPVPYGYHPETRARKGLVITGAVLFGVSYLLSTLVATENSSTYDYDSGTYQTRSYEALWIPVIPT